MPHTYEKHQRDYTITGITSCFEGFATKELETFYGTTFSEIISVVQDGVYYHFEVVGDKENICKKFLARVNNDEIDFDKEYQKYDTEVGEYEKLITQDEKFFSLKTILDFYRFYKDLIKLSYIGMDCVDYVHLLDENKRDTLTLWATKIRRRGEVIYKKGEMEFVPKFLSWFGKKYAPEINVDLLQYITHIEMNDFATKQKQLPSQEELEQRKECLFIRQYPCEQFEILSGDEAKKKIESEKLFESKSDGFEKLQELQGTSAYAGLVRGKVCIIRSRIELDKFEDGDVIVSQMTDPSYLPIMKRASAFVTNEGGMLCHAAIVARELKKPCVVGTKHATHVFRDGEMVEVDAGSGLVKKI